jgi:hypothetical protein
MYGGKCENRRCSQMLKKYHPEIYVIESNPKRIFVYGLVNCGFFHEKRKVSFCPKEIYGY